MIYQAYRQNFKKPSSQTERLVFESSEYYYETESYDFRQYESHGSDGERTAIRGFRYNESIKSISAMDDSASREFDSHDHFKVMSSMINNHHDPHQKIFTNSGSEADEKLNVYEMGRMSQCVNPNMMLEHSSMSSSEFKSPQNMVQNLGSGFKINSFG